MLIKHIDDASYDIIGDVHGEFDTLMGLIKVLGYESNGFHPEGRRLIF